MTLDFLIYLLGIPAWWAVGIVGARLGRVEPGEAGLWLLAGLYWPLSLGALICAGTVRLFQRVMEEVTPEDDQ